MKVMEMHDLYKREATNSLALAGVTIILPSPPIGMFLSLGIDTGLVLLSLGFGAEKPRCKMNSKG